jgi:hypothetical protein
VDDKLDIFVLTTSSEYGKGGPGGKTSASLVDGLKVIKINFPKLKIDHDALKFIWSIIEGLWLVIQAWRLRIETVITLSNPPFINLWSSYILKRRKWLYWSFDLYPDALFSDAKLNRRSILGRFIARNTYKNPPYGIIALGERQKMYLQKKYLDPIQEQFVLPCGIIDTPLAASVPLWASNAGIILGYAGNIGRAHSVEFLINVINEVKCRPDIRMVISVYGCNRVLVEKAIEDASNPNIFLVPTVNQAELGWIDVHLVTLEEEWTNVSVPSKAVSAVCSGSAIWFCGSTESDTYREFQECCYYSKGERLDVIAILNSISRSDVEIKRANAQRKKCELLIREGAVINRVVSLIKNDESGLKLECK